MQIRLIQDPAEFMALASRWDAFVTDLGQCTPFSCHAWFAAWLQASPETPLRLWLAEDQQGLLGLWPLTLSEERWRKRVGGGLAFLRNPETPFMDAWVRDASVLEAMIQAQQAQPGWRWLRLDGWLPGPALGYFEALAAAQSVLAIDPVAAPYVSIEGSWEDYWQSRSVRTRKAHRNVINKLEKTGTIEVKHWTQPQQVTQVLQVMTHLEARSWKQSEGRTLVNDNRLRDFFNHFTPLAAARGWLSCYALFLDGQALAVEYQLTQGERVWGLRGDYDEAHAALSPGAYLNLELIKRLFEAGYRHYDMGPGLSDYKLRLSTGVQQRPSHVLFRNDLPGKLLCHLETQWLPRLKRWRKIDA